MHTLTYLTLRFLIEAFGAIPLFIQTVLKPNIFFCHCFLFCYEFVFPTAPFRRNLIGVFRTPDSCV